MSDSVRFKICGLTRSQDAKTAAVAGATYGGVILAEGSPRTVTPERARAVFTGSSLRRCGVFVNPSIEELVRASATAGLDVIQLHGDEDADFVRTAKGETRAEVWKVVRPRSGAEFAAAAADFAAVADGLMLDGWSAEARGGTGTRFPWEEVAERMGDLPSQVRLIVAGGLNPENVAEVISILRPAIVDVSSGVESEPGIKDGGRVRAFAKAVREASAGIRSGTRLDTAARSLDLSS